MWQEGNRIWCSKAGSRRKSMFYGRTTHKDEWASTHTSIERILSIWIYTYILLRSFIKQWFHSQDILEIFISFLLWFSASTAVCACNMLWPYKSRIFWLLCLKQSSFCPLGTECSAPATLITIGVSDNEETLPFLSLLAPQYQKCFSQLKFEILNWEYLPPYLDLKETGAYTGPSPPASTGARPWHFNSWHVAFAPNSCFLKLQCMLSNHMSWVQQCLVFFWVPCVLFSFFLSLFVLSIQYTG